MDVSIKTEVWDGHKIRFVFYGNEWWAIAIDVAKALDYRMASDMTRYLDRDEVCTLKVRMENYSRKMLVISETGIYEAVFNSHKPEAKDFKLWVKQTLKLLRQASGLEGFQIFRMLDKEHQKEMMAKLNDGIKNPVKVDFCKANNIANKTISSMFGYKKMIKKGDMTPDMLIKREPVLGDVVNLMVVNDEFNLGCSISKKIYEKYH